MPPRGRRTLSVYIIHVCLRFVKRRGEKRGDGGVCRGCPAPPGLNPGGTGYPCRLRSRRGAGGLAPARHLFALPRGRGPSQTPKFLSPGPPSPWLPAPPIEWLFYRFCAELAMPKASPCRMPDWQVEPVSPGQAPPAGYHSGRDCKCRRRLNAGDARGEAPCIRKQKISPFPPGRGAGGMGAGNQTKGRVGGRQRRQAPRRVPPTPAETATPGTSPPSGYHSGRGCKCRKRFNAGVPGAKPPAK